MAQAPRPRNRERPVRYPHQDQDTVDEAITNMQQVGGPVDMEHAFPYPLDEQPAPDAPRVTPLPGQRLQEIEAVMPRYKKEYQLRLLHRMMMRNLPMDMIAQSMQLSVSQVYKLRMTLLERLRVEASKTDFMTHVGQTLGFYNEVRGLAMRIASDGNAKVTARLTAMHAALQAEGDKHRFLQVSGFYDAAKFVPGSIGTEDPAQQQAQTLIEMSRALFRTTTDADDDANLFDNVLEHRAADEEDDVRVLGG